MESRLAILSLQQVVFPGCLLKARVVSAQVQATHLEEQHRDTVLKQRVEVQHRDTVLNQQMDIKEAKQHMEVSPSEEDPQLDRQ